MKATLKVLLKQAYLSGVFDGRLIYPEQPNGATDKQNDANFDSWLRDAFGDEEIVITHRLDE